MNALDFGDAACASYICTRRREYRSEFQPDSQDDRYGKDAGLNHSQGQGGQPFTRCNHGHTDELCALFQHEARCTWALLRTARKHGRQLLEETITDLRLLDWARADMSHFTIHSYTKPRERQVGADWEWWFHGANGVWLGMRVQAKIIQFATDTYPQLHYTPKNATEHQTDRLVRAALSAQPQRIPMYCLYTHWNHKKFGRPDARSGCSLISPFVIRAFQRQNVNDLASLSEFMTPWHNLVCGPTSPHSNLPTQVARLSKDVFERYNTRSPIAFLDDPDNALNAQQAMNIEPSNQAPEYVLRIATGEDYAPDAVADPGLAAVTVISEGRR
jgi:hypothetical protein